MRREFKKRLEIALACLTIVISGCGRDPFAPPTRLKSNSELSRAETSKAPFLVYVVPGVPKGDLEVWAVRAQHEANDKRAIFRIMGPGPGESPAQQPEIVRRALAEGASALLVYPGDAPELPKVLAEAETKGVPVVLIDKAIPAPEGAKPFTVVEHGPFEDTARKIVSATLEDLKKAGKPADGTAILLVDKVTDRNSARRVAALKAAAEAAKFGQTLTVPFDGSVEDSARLAVLEAVKAHPDISVVLAEDAEGIMGGSIARSELQGQPIFFVGGYTDYRSSRIVNPPILESSYVEGRFSELGGLAVLTVLAKLRGEAVAEHSYLTPRFARGEGVIASLANPGTAIPGPKNFEKLKDIIKDIAPPSTESTPKP